ncbi:regulator of G-protein signaling 7-binding protein-like isoform X2 [Acanthaster planci]|uniref:Regulator of G-protein signaling 7-binding protein-like isoform X2 n=1 Tax=Acanthaster planci TaxID=133434 RepID=A0A8B7ZTP7_ACAPL|nr:regulator of G-protein signaling 7-binding protein-like isoform X2 [Acanthaster planci]
MNRTSSGRGCSSRPRSAGPSSLTVPHAGARVHHHPQHVGSPAGYGGGGGEFVHTPEDSYDEATLKGCVDECEKLVRDFNTRVAQYREKLIGIADVSDSLHFREDIRRKRRKGLDAARNAKYKLFPHMRGRLTKPDFQRLFIQLTGCMHLFIAEMRKSLVLLSAFPIDHVGMVMMMEIAGPSHDRRGGSHKGRELTVSEISDQLEESVILDGPMATSEDLQLIAKDMEEVRHMLSEVDLDEMIPRQRSPDELTQVTSIHRQSSLVRLRRRMLCCCSRPKHIKT